MNQPAQQQEPPGRTGEMNPRPDHGEESYRGSGRLAGKAAVVTGADLPRLPPRAAGPRTASPAALTRP
jgi:hypothetical protein